jgi:hypothetical protein
VDILRCFNPGPPSAADRGQRRALHLAQRRLRQRRHDAMRRGCLKRASRASNSACRAAVSTSPPLARHHGQHRHLAPARIGQADHGALGHLGVAGSRFSISAGWMFSPPEMISSLLRPTTS